MAGLQNLWGRKEGALTKKEIFANDIPSEMDSAWHYKVFILFTLLWLTIDIDSAAYTAPTVYTFYVYKQLWTQKAFLRSHTRPSVMEVSP